MRALYRKYRPKSLCDVIGQKQVTEPLGNALKLGKISHAYLFIGPRGCGKTSVARIFAHAVNNFDYEIEDNYVDIIEIDGASNRGIDNIRDLKEKVMIAPTIGKYKIYIIDEVHMLTKEAFNALLKTLEEPPKHAIFIMATTDAYKVPVTITSRSQTYTFKLADSEVMLDFLRSVADTERIAIDEEALKIIVRRGGGSFRDSLSLLDQISTLSDEKITKERVLTAMGLPQDEKIVELLNEYTAGDVVKITTLLKDLLASGVKSETLAEEIIAQIIRNPQTGLLGLLGELTSVQAPFAEAKLIVALCGNARSFAPSIVSAATAPMAENIKVSEKVVKKVAPSDFSVKKVSESKSQSKDMSFNDAIIYSDTNNPSGASTFGSFDWDIFTQKVKTMNDAVYLQLTKSKYEIVGGNLNIYPGKKIIKNILLRNKQILAEATDGSVKIIIRDEDEKPTNIKKDELLTKISDIMGGEVKEDGGGNPFE